jgi:polysaccharide biosynthesis/export protein
MRVLLLTLLAVTAARAAEPEPRPVPEPATAPRSLVLAPGDEIQVSVFGHPDLTSTVRVAGNGSIELPLIGTVAGVLGADIDALAQRIQAAYLDGYLTQAQVLITPQSFGPRTAFLLGALRTPGPITLSPYVGITALQALSQAGGYTADADPGKAMILRDDAAGGPRQSILVPSAGTQAGAADDPVLRPGDLLVVPQMARAFITGAVRNSGAVNLPSSGQLHVSQAISLAGGFERFARQAQVQLLRAGASTVVDVQALLAGQKVDDPVLQPGDTIFVPESRF